MTELISLFQAGIMFGTVILFGALGEILTEKSGNLNLGVPGIMYLGGIMGLMGVFFYEMNNPAPNKIVCILIALSCAFAASVLGGLIYSLLTTTLRANQNVTGLTLTIFAGGFANFFGGSLNKLAGGVGQISVSTTSAAFRTNLPFASDLPPILNMLLGFGFMVYLAVALAFVMHWFLNRTSTGLNLRAVGENAGTADAAGIRVMKYKYLSTCIGAGISGLGGLYYVMDYTKGTWDSDGGIERLGWLAVALVIFSSWKPRRVIWGAYLFGMLSWLYFYIPDLTRRSMELFKMLPYAVTILVLVAVSLRRKRENQPPAGLGLPYFREER
jgi:simple sugar transport system permease protein